MTDTRGHCPSRNQKCRVHALTDKGEGHDEKVRTAVVRKICLRSFEREPMLSGRGDDRFKIFDFEIVGIALEAHSLP
jgi:hypothetical protein